MATQRAIDSANPQRPSVSRGRAHRPASASSSPGEDRATDRRGLTLLVVAATSLIVVAWLVLVFLFDPVRFVVLNPRAKTGFEIFLALGQVFGAFVLAVSAIGPERSRLHRVAAGLIVLGFGAIGLGYLYPLVFDAPVLSATMYGSLYARSISMIAITAGLLPAVVTPIRRAPVLALAVVTIAVGIALIAASQHLPPLLEVHGMTTVIDHNPAVDGSVPPNHAHMADLDGVASSAHTVFPGLTGWYTSLSLVPLLAGVLAVIGAARQHVRRALGTWLLVAVVLLAGSQLHSVFWPSMYSSILTTTSVLRFAVAVVIITGGVLELRQIVEERARLIAHEQERVRRLQELAALKADFTSIVAHELASPLAAIGMMSEMIAIGGMPAEQTQHVAGSIGAEARGLQVLVEDVRASADVERDDFHVHPRRVSIDTLMSRAEAFARTLPGEHPLKAERDVDGDVLADPERIGQVLRNLLANAARHTPPGTPVVLRARQQATHVAIEVADAGSGIAPEDRARIFEKFGRGGDAWNDGVPGRGLGLYLSRRIVQAHGSDLKLESEPGHGTTFAFTLELVP